MGRLSYDISFKAKVEGVDAYVDVACDANITYNLGTMIRKSTGLEWNNCENNGLVKDIMPHIYDGLKELNMYPEKYKQYDSENVWGTIEGCKGFFERIIKSWEDLCDDYWGNKELKDVVTFWIE